MNSLTFLFFFFFLLCSSNFVSSQVFDIYHFFTGDWTVSVSRSSLETHNYIAAPHQERLVLKAGEGTSLEGIWYTDESELPVSVEFPKPGSGVFYLSDDDSEQIQLFSFTLRNHSNGFFISQGPWKKSSVASSEGVQENSENSDLNTETEVKKDVETTDSNTITPQNFYHLTITTLHTFVLNVYVQRTSGPAEIRTYTFWKAGGRSGENSGGFWKTWGTPFLVFLAVLVPRLIFPGPGQLPAHDHSEGVAAATNKLKNKKQ